MCLYRFTSPMTVPLDSVLPRSRTIIFLSFSLVSILLFRAYVLTRRYWKIGQITILHELPKLGKPRQGGRLIDGTVVIAGGSIAGLLTAQICSTHFTRVLIVEPDTMLSTSATPFEEPGAPATASEGKNRKIFNPRPRVMQYTSGHNFQVLTLWALKELFPDIEVEALKVDPQAIVHADSKVYIGNKHLKPPLAHYKGDLPKHLNVGRPTYETLLRRLVKRDCDNVEFFSGFVTGYQLDGKAGPQGTGASRIESVTIRSKDGLETIEPAILLVDCTGSAQAGLKWITNSTNPCKIAKDVYNPKICYTTCIFDVEPSLMDKLQIPGGYANARTIFTRNSHPRMKHDPRSLYIIKREHNTLHVACGGYDVFDRPKCINDIRTVIAKFAGPDPVPAYVYQLLDILEDHCEESAAYLDARCAPFSFVKYHGVADQLPNNFIAIGDSLMILNPIRGQGCIKAMIGAATLNGLLRSCKPVSNLLSSGVSLPENFGKRFWESQNKRTYSFWTTTKAADYNWDTTIPVEGESLKDGAFVRWYNRTLLDVAFKNEDVAATLYDITMLITPACYAIRPGIAIRVLWMGLKNYLGLEL
ncbi:hypothetical protein SISSUDRAFT_1133201 [Sistotremastrum suecicum HHB10207 ss-3]|uniref:FAD/NAD(P)-binding domain-containing protein n=1 Tax=Sistotremastrum suecicum HHB10207 ss-3 TaxID=1314776 RepID=A0A165XMX0_9AGAM|nr:hypothetical protein SISSUDRAFT_1133201 [Sistotremastrum suecicum HHB10207 ss-3]